MKVEEFIDRYFYKGGVQELLERAGVQSKGAKKELIVRLREEANYDFFQTMSCLQKDDLREVCEDLNLPSSGKKDVLVKRILKEISKDWSEDYFVSEINRATKNHGWSERQLRKALGSLYKKFEKGKKAIQKEDAVRRPLEEPPLDIKWIAKCPKCNVDSATYRAQVKVCPKCHSILDAQELFRLLEQMGMSKKLIKSALSEITLKKSIK